MMNYALVGIAYLLGAIPFSLILGLVVKRKDIRKYGSGNPGATNATRVFGIPIGLATATLDILKSGLVVFLIVRTSLFQGVQLFHPLVYGVAAILGHCYPVWLGFRGGKGVASTFGVLLAYDPLIGLGFLVVFLAVAIATRYVSVGSTAAALSAVGFATLSHVFRLPDLGMVLATVAAAAIIVVRHQSNYRHLRAGTEARLILSDLQVPPPAAS